MIEQPEDERPTTRPIFPDLIPSSRTSGSASRVLPSAGSPSRQALLEVVKETLGRRIQLRNPIYEEQKDGQEKEEPAVEEERPVLPRAPPLVSNRSPRVGLFNVRHEGDAITKDKLGRLTVQSLPSVTIATRAVMPPSRVIEIQSRSISSAQVSLEPEQDGKVDCNVSLSASSKSEEEAVATDRSIQPEEVARIVSEILANQVDLAFDSFQRIDQQCEQQSLAEHYPSRLDRSSSSVRLSTVSLNLSRVKLKFTNCIELR